MVPLLVRPYLLVQKNRLLKKVSGRLLLSWEFYAALAILLSIVMLYLGMVLFLEAFQKENPFGSVLPIKMMSLALLSFLALLTISNFVSAISSLFGSSDMPLLLTVPVSRMQLYLSRLIETAFMSAWMFVLFAVPACLAYRSVFQLPWSFVGAAIATGIPFTVIPAALGVTLALVFVNLFAAARMSETLALFGFGILSVLLLVGTGLSGPDGAPRRRVGDLTRDIVGVETGRFDWLPSQWTADLLGGFFTPLPAGYGIRCAVLLVGVAVLAVLAGYFAFELLFMRGWMRTFEGSRLERIQVVTIGSFFPRRFMPIDTQTRAMVGKEFRLLFRDTAQFVQLLLILVLGTFYLSNFRIVRFVSPNSAASELWWIVFLSGANVVMGGCVAAAVAARFVYPAISLEGQAYTLLRSTPISVRRILWCKFVSYIFPASVVAVVLIGSGAMAIEVPRAVVWLSVFDALVLSLSMVGLALGIGAVYARFDWESAAQVTSNFGSLVFMFLGLVVVLLNTIPSAMLLFIGCCAGKGTLDWSIETWSSLVLVGGFLLLFHGGIAALSIRVAETSLLEAER